MIHGQAESNQSLRPTAWPRPYPTPPEQARRVVIGSLRRGFEWTDAFGHFCLLNDVVPVLTNSSYALQTVMVFDQIEALLDRLGFTFNHVVRTWFSLADIARWHDDFNRVRTSFYSERGLLGRVPASTELGDSNPQRVAVRAHVLACRPHAEVVATAVGARQSSAGSAVNHAANHTANHAAAPGRGILLRSAEGKRLYVSATTSTDQEYRTLFPNAVERQLKEALRVVRTMLDRQGLDFNDGVGATVYLSDLANEELVRNLARPTTGLHLSCASAQFVRADVCCAIELIAERYPC